ncbi:GntR family transcriptional regulator [Bacilliculturomica massiliensis]|uniref:GntR family transcriptional regulator n=1 Tax=Bacilliculturomica massiliensis TaxID=1917867 RepID=UPI0010316EDB|nr:GntR family transcriptional regulator [Bacilliculturomica massiliensis]
MSIYRNNAITQAAGSSLSTNLFNQLRTDILQGKLKPGEKLTEQRVCNEYTVSRTPVREAFQKLEIDGLIETIPNRGAFVVGITTRDIQDMYELRKAYEAIAVRWAIERITKEEFEELQEAYEFMEFYTMKKDADKMLNINMHFHELIYNAAHNRMLLHVLTSYQVYTKQTRTNHRYVDGYLEEVLAEHKQIFQAFVDQDPEAGTRAIITHLDNAKRRAALSD